MGRRLRHTEHLSERVGLRAKREANESSVESHPQEVENGFQNLVGVFTESKAEVAKAWAAIDSRCYSS